MCGVPRSWCLCGVGGLTRELARASWHGGIAALPSDFLLRVGAGLLILASTKFRMASLVRLLASARSVRVVITHSSPLDRSHCRPILRTDAFTTLGGLQSDMGSILDDLDDDVVRSGLLALAIMILILLPNFCFRVPKPKFE